MNNPVRVLMLAPDGGVRCEFGADLAAERDGWLVAWHDAGRHARHSQGRIVEPVELPYIVFFLAQHEPLAVACFFEIVARVHAIECEASRPAVLSGRVIQVVGLDLGLVVLPGGHWFTRGLGEYKQNRDMMAYGQKAETLARSGLQLARELATGQAYPFGGHAEQVLGVAIASDGPL